VNWTIEKQETNWKCHICNSLKPPGAMAIIYLQSVKSISAEGQESESVNKIRWTCLWHPLCQIYLETGSFCSNHEEGLDEECNSVPF